MVSYVIHADDPEAVKAQIVEWLSYRASEHRVNASKATLVRTRKTELVKAFAYQNASDFLGKAVIKPLIVN